MANVLTSPEEIEMKVQNPSNPLSPDLQNPVQEPLPSIHDEMKSLKDLFLGANPIAIKTPFEGTALVVTKDESRYIFSSKQSRIAVCDAKTSKLVIDKHIKEKEIWTIAICQNDSMILVAGTSSLIRKLQYPSLVEIDTLKGHTGEINYVLASHDDQWIFSCGDDGTVRKWPLNETSPESQILYNHQGCVFGMGLALDSSLICTAGEEGDCKVYRVSGNPDTDGTVLQTLVPPGEQNKLWICRFSPNNAVVAAGSQDSSTYIWSTSTWELVRRLEGHTGRVRCMNFSHSGHVLITGSIDSTIRVWDMIENKDSIKLNHHYQDKWVRATIITADSQFCISIGDDRRIVKWKIPGFDKIVNLQSDETNVLRIWVSKDSKKIFSVSDHYIVREWDAVTGVQKNKFAIEVEDILAYAVSGDTYNIYIFSKAENPEDPDTFLVKASLYNVESGDLVKEKTLKYFDLCSSYSTYDSQFVVIGTKFTVDLYDTDFNLIDTYRNHSKKVISIVCSPNTQYMFSASSDGELIMTDLIEKTMVKKLLKQADNNPVTLMRVSSEGETLIAVHPFSVDIFSITKRCKIITIPQTGIKNVNFNEDNTKAFFFERESLTVYNTDNYSVFYRQVFVSPTSHITFAPNRKFWVVYRGRSSRIVPSHLQITNFECVGKRGEEHLFKKYIADIIKDKSPTHEEDFDKWVIMPNGMNTTHLYAYYNLPNYLQKAYENGASFFPSKTGHTALSIALDLKYLNCIRAVIKGLTQSMKANPLTLYYFSGSLTQLNDLGYSGLHRIYEYMFTRCINKSLPKFSEEKLSNIYIENPKLIPDKNDFLTDDFFSNDGFALIFKQSYCKLPLVPGSEESLEFIRSLIECTNNKIYDTEIIKLYLEQKWLKTRWIMYGLTLLYYSYMALLVAHTIVDKNERSFIFGAFIVELVLIFYEIIQIWINKLEYFKDFWNLVDLVKAFLFLVYFLLVQFGAQEKNSLLAVVLFISLLRGITYFRIAGDTRKYINLLYEVVFDLIPFLIIFYYSGIGFAMIFLALGREKNSNLLSYLADFYPADLSAYDTSLLEDDKAAWLNYFLATLLISIVMLSLVVSVLSDTYGRVSAHLQVADSQALAQMIYECELLYFWNRSKPESKFVFLCTEQEDPTLQNVDVKEKVIKLKNLVTVLAKKINSNRRLIRRVMSDYVDEGEQIFSSLTEIAR